jgi:hypothetical protein
MADLTDQVWVVIRAPISKLFELTFMKVFYTTYYISFFLMSLLTIVRLVMWLCGKWPSLDRWVPWGKWLWVWFVANYTLVMIPYPSPTRCSSCRSFGDKHLAFVGVGMFFYYLYFGLSWLCERYPLIAKALLIDRRPSDLAKIEHLPPQHRLGYDTWAGVLYSPPWFCFCIFLTDLAICVLWYGLAYDSTGTVNPGWTYVFG